MERTILATCCVPWDAAGRFDEEMFRETVKRLSHSGFTDLYIFGTAGEGHSVSDQQFAAIAEAFIDEVGDLGGEPMVGVISVSLETIHARIERAVELGARRFQIALPNWGLLDESEIALFFDAICGTHTQCTFMHYNLMRSGRILRGTDYRRLADHSNLVATKYGGGDPEIITGLLVDAPHLRHFFTELGFFPGGAIGPCSLLASVAASNPATARQYFDAVVSGEYALAAQLYRELALMLAQLRRVVGPHLRADGAYDKIIARTGDARFPLRLLSPWEGAGAEAFEGYVSFLERRFPHWLPDDHPGYRPR